MFAADEDRVSHYGKNHYTLDLKRLHPKHVVDAASPAFQRAVKKALLEAPELLEQFGAGKEQSAQALAAQLAAETAPRDIVDSAGLWDAPELVSHVWDKVIEPNGWRAVKTPNGAISFYSEDTKAAAPSRYAEGGAVENKDVRRALMIARDQRNLLRRIANIYPGPGGGMDPSPGGGGYSGPGGGKYIGPSRYADGGSVPPFKLHSGAAKIIKSKGQAKATPQQYAAMPGIKPDELKHSKFDTLGSKALPREEVIKHLEDNALPLEETQLGGEGRNTSTKFDEHQLPGGKNYREVLLHLPVTHTPAPELGKARERADAATRAYDDALNDQLSGPDDFDVAYTRASAEADAARIALARLERADRDTAARAGFRGGHWEEPDVLAHVRMSDRGGPNGEKILHLEEAQSDWGQQGRDQGFAPPPENLERAVKARDAYLAELPTRVRAELERRIAKARSEGKEPDVETAKQIAAEFDEKPRDAARFLGETDKHNELLNAAMPARTGENHIPNGPYVDNTQKWTDLALKRVLHEAAHGGYDRIVVTPGDEQNKRYDLSKHVKNIQYYPDLGYLHATTHDNQSVEHEDMKPEDLSKHIGKEAADRILKQGMQRYEGRGKRGGEFYHELEGDGLKVGGAGMRGYYDNILPKRLQALAQQHDPQAKMNLHDSFQDAPTTVPNTIITRQRAPMTLHSLDVTPQMRDSIKQSGFNSFKRGGEVGDDPIKDWQWRPTEDVRNELQLDEIPSHVHKFGEFMDESARKAMNEGFTPRDLIKAYTITRASIQRRARPVEAIRKSGLILPPDLKGVLRPEGAFGHWLHTKHGQRYLDEAEAGRVDEEAIADAQKIMKPYGKTKIDLPDALRWAPANLPGREGRISELVTRAYRGHDHPDDWRDATAGLKGIGPAKKGFYGANLGYGKLPTLDAREITVHTGRPTKEATPYLRKKGAADAAVDRLANRQTELGLKHDKSMSPFYQHLTHHTVWDKASGETTTHDDLMHPMRNAKDGGRQGYAHGGRGHNGGPPLDDPMNILGHPVARLLATLGPNWVNPLDEAAQAAGMVPGELAHKLRMRTGDKGDKLSKLAPQTDWAAHSVKLARAMLDPIQRIDPHEIAKNRGTFIAGPGDRQITDAEIHGLNGIEFANPVRGHGGPFYPRGEAGRAGAAWASAQAPVSKQLGMAESAERLGRTPYHVPWSMSRGAVDSTPMMWELIANLLPHAKINKTSRAMIDRSIRSHVIDKEGTRPFRGAPSIASEEFPKWVGAMGLGERYALMTALEKTSHIVKGFPEPAALRLAITEPEYVAPRSLTAGRVITQMDPKAGIIHDPAVPHPGYPKQFMKKGNVMGFERPAPLGLMFPKAWKTIAGDLDPEVASVPNNVNRAFQMGNISQPVDNEVADNLASYFAREKGKPFKKAGGRAGYTPGGGVEQLQQNLHQSFSDLNRQVAAQGPQQQQQAMPQAPYGAYQRMERQATGQAPNDAYQRMMAQALNGKTYEEMFPTSPKVAAPAPAVAPVQLAAADAMPYYQTNYGPSPTEILGGDGTGSGDFKRGGRANKTVERALAITRKVKHG